MKGVVVALQPSPLVLPLHQQPPPVPPPPVCLPPPLSPIFRQGWRNKRREAMREKSNKANENERNWWIINQSISAPGMEKKDRKTPSWSCADGDPAERATNRIRNWIRPINCCSSYSFFSLSLSLFLFLVFSLFLFICFSLPNFVAYSPFNESIRRLNIPSRFFGIVQNCFKMAQDSLKLLRDSPRFPNTLSRLLPDSLKIPSRSLQDSFKMLWDCPRLFPDGPRFFKIAQDSFKIASGLLQDPFQTLSRFFEDTLKVFESLVQCLEDSSSLVSFSFLLSDFAAFHCRNKSTRNREGGGERGREENQMIKADNKEKYSKFMKKNRFVSLFASIGAHLKVIRFFRRSLKDSRGIL